MIRFNRFSQYTVFYSLLFCISLSASADDLQDANKLIKRGQYSEALSKVDGYLSGQPKDAQARFLKGVILTEQGQTDEAIRIFSALSKDYPELPEPYNNLAVLYAGQGEYEKAKVALEAAIRTHPSYATAHENLGDIYAKMASQAYDRALQMDRNNASTKTKLTLITNLYAPAIKTSTGKTNIAALPVPVTPPASITPPTVATAPVTVAVTPSPTVVVAANPVPVPPKPAVAEAQSSNSEEEIHKALNTWANAWTSGNVKSYLAMYAKTFNTPNHESRSSWEQERRVRIDKPLPISVTISNAKVRLLDDSHATVNFIQFYRSGKLKSTTRKTLEMIKTDGKWQIQSEQTGGKG